MCLEKCSVFYRFFSLSGTYIIRPLVPILYYRHNSNFRITHDERAKPPEQVQPEQRHGAVQPAGAELRQTGGGRHVVAAEQQQERLSTAKRRDRRPVQDDPRGTGGRGGREAGRGHQEPQFPAELPDQRWCGQDDQHTGVAAAKVRVPAADVARTGITAKDRRQVAVAFGDGHRVKIQRRRRRRQVARRAIAHVVQPVQVRRRRRQVNGARGRLAVVHVQVCRQVAAATGTGLVVSAKARRQVHVGSRQRFARGPRCGYRGQMEDEIRGVGDQAEDSLDPVAET